MEITRTNFTETLPQVKEAIARADFLSLDCELTGLHSCSDIHAFDTQKEYYEKLFRSSKHFLVIQYGLCAFRYDASANAFKHQSYNFYVFPRQINRMAPDHRFMCQASSIEFLANQGFDFNKLFNEGISYLNDVEKEKYEEQLGEQQKLRANQNKKSPQNDKSNHIAINGDDKVKVDNIFKEIEKFIKSDEQEMILPRCNAFIRRLVYQEAPMRIKNAASLETRTKANKDRDFVVTKPKSEDEKEEREKAALEKEETELADSIGFAEVLKAVVSSGKLVIGHNMILDLLHTIDKFLTPLPANYREFKDCAHCLFSNVIDTKYMASAEPFKEHIESTVLIHVLNSLRNEPFAMPSMEVEENRQSYSLEEMKEHEAGFDAFITGICFIAMWQHLEKLEKVEGEKSFQDFSILKQYTNKLFLMRLQDNPHINLGGDDSIPNRSNVLYVTFPKTWKLNDIMQLFSPFGNVYVSWIDEKSAYVGLQQKNQIALALKTLAHGESYSVMSYAKRQSQMKGQDLPAASPHPAAKKKAAQQMQAGRKRRASDSKQLPLTKKQRNIDTIIEEEVELVEEEEGTETKAFEESVDWE